MSLLPRWKLMTEDAKALTRTLVLSALFLLLIIWFIRVLIPWVVIAIVGYWMFRLFSKNN